MSRKSAPRLKAAPSQKPNTRQILVEFITKIFAKLKKVVNLKNKSIKDLYKYSQVILLKAAKDKKVMVLFIQTAKELAKKYKSLNYKQIVIMVSNPKISKEQVKRNLEKANKYREKKIGMMDKMSLDQLIAKCPDKKQKQSWEKIKNLKWPKPRGTVKLVILVGGLGLNAAPDAKKMIQSMKKIYKDKLKVVRIPNPPGTVAKGKPNSALSRFKREVQKRDNSDIIIPFLSGHGSHDKKSKSFVFQENSKKRNDLKRGISTMDLKKIMRTTPNKKYLYMIDACFSGSATDDPISKERNLLGIIASSGHYISSGGPKGGLFTGYFSKYIGNKMNLGEAFIRADAATSLLGTGSQDPTAVFNVGNKQISIN